MRKLLWLFLCFGISPGWAGDFYFNGHLGQLGTAFDGSGDSAYSIGGGVPIAEIGGNRLDLQGFMVGGSDFNFYTLALQGERSVAQGISAAVRIGGSHISIDGERDFKICNPDNPLACEQQTRERSQGDGALMAGAGMIGHVDDDLDVELRLDWFDIDSKEDFSHSVDEALLSFGLRYWF